METKKIRKILIANRGEIAARVLRAASELQIPAAVVYAGDDTHHAYLKDGTEKHRLEGTRLAETFLNHKQIIQTAIACGADAIHPGYGFLSEDPLFASMCRDHGITWIGPSPESMLIMASKSQSRQEAIKAGVPVLKAWSGTREQLLDQAGAFEYPVLIKAAAGGGGRGMRIIRSLDQFASQIDPAMREAELFFGNPEIFVEQYIEPARHIEVQILGDHHGNVIHLLERECTIQRRYQKILEECPSPTLTDEERALITGYALALARQTGYNNAGTAEFLMGPCGAFYFIEMNARIQVEHPVTEMVTGIDLVKEQIRIAMGMPLVITQDSVKIQKHAIECRIIAEDPQLDFMPSPGTIHRFEPPQSEGTRTDHALTNGAEITTHYDPMVAKLIVSAGTRMEAIEKLRQGLADMVLHGITTNREFQMIMTGEADFRENRFHTHFIREHGQEWSRKLKQFKSDPEQIRRVAIGMIASRLIPQKGGNPWLTIGSWRHLKSFRIMVDQLPIYLSWEPHGPKSFLIKIENKSILITQPSRRDSLLTLLADGNPESYSITDLPDGSSVITCRGYDHQVAPEYLLRQLTHQSTGGNGQAAKNGSSRIVAPLPGKILKLLVEPGSKIRKGESVVIIESMKTENQVLAPGDMTIQNILVSVGQDVKLNESLITAEFN